MKVPHERYHNDVQGMPAFAGNDKFVVNVSAESMAEAVPQDDERCAIALGCKKQLQTPYVSVGRSRTDLALPHPLGVKKEGYGETLWAVVRFKNSKEAREIIIAADTGTLDDKGTVVEFLPAGRENLPGVKKQRNKTQRRVTGKKQKDKGESDELTEMGVRILTGQRRR